MMLRRKSQSGLKLSFLRIIKSLILCGLLLSVMYALHECTLILLLFFHLHFGLSHFFLLFALKQQFLKSSCVHAHCIHITLLSRLTWIRLLHRQFHRHFHTFIFFWIILFSWWAKAVAFCSAFVSSLDCMASRFMVVGWVRSFFLVLLRLFFILKALHNSLLILQHQGKRLSLNILIPFNHYFLKLIKILYQ